MLDLEKLGRLCRARRKQNGYSQSDVAKVIGYSFRTISAFESGRNDSASILYWYLETGIITGKDVISCRLNPRENI